MDDALLSLRGVSKSFWRGSRKVEVLHEVSLQVHPGELVAVWGRRGAGKTTLLQIAAGIERCDRGVASLEGRDLGTFSERELAICRRDVVGWVQSARPRSELPVATWVALAVMHKHSRRTAERLAQAALQRLGVEECATQRWNDLSAGERALASIAYAIVRSPRLLLVDDPTIALHADERETVAAMLRALAVDDGMGVLMTAPDMSSMMYAHRIGTLSGARLITPPSSGGAAVVELPIRRRSG
jgi:putative ABC transport system ATP-binding protein